MSNLKLQMARCAFERSRVIAFRLPLRRFQSFRRYLATFSISRNDFHRRIDIGREYRRLSRQIFDFVYSIFQKNDAAAIPGPPPPFQPNIIAETRMRDERGGGSRRKRISSISQRVAVTVSVMAFGSVVESYSCANPIRALLRVYFRTRVACTYVCRRTHRESEMRISPPAYRIIHIY